MDLKQFVPEGWQFERVDERHIRVCDPCASFNVVLDLSDQAPVMRVFWRLAVDLMEQASTAEVQAQHDNAILERGIQLGMYREQQRAGARAVECAAEGDVLRDGAEAVAVEAYQHALNGGHIQDLYKLPQRCAARAAHQPQSKGTATVKESLQVAPLTRKQIDDIMTQHYPLDSLLSENVDAFEACVRDIEKAIAAQAPAPGADTSKIAAYLRWIMRTVNNFEAKTGKGGWFAEEMQDACNAIAKETGTPVKFGISSYSTDYEHPTGDNPFPGAAVKADASTATEQLLDTLFDVLEGHTMPGDVRKQLEAAYWQARANIPKPPVQGGQP